MSHLEKIQKEYRETEEPLLDEMRNFFESRSMKPSVSHIQRHFKMGYNRATKAFNQLNNPIE